MYSCFVVNILFHPQSAFYPWSAVCSLHFTPGLQSAVCSLQSAFYTDRIQDRSSFILIRSKHVFKKTTFASEYAILLTNLQRLFNLKKDILCLKLTENLERDNVFCCYFVCIKPQFVSRWRPCGSSRKGKTQRRKLLNAGKLVTHWSTKYF